MSLVRQSKPASVPKHMRMGLETKLGAIPCPLHHPCKSGSGEGRAAFAGDGSSRAVSLAAEFDQSLSL